MISNGASLNETVREICSGVEELLPGCVCSVWTVNPAGMLHPLPSPTLPHEYLNSCAGVMSAPDIGSCGEAAYTREPVLTLDIATDPRWAKRRDAALSLQLKASYSVPIMAERDRVIGTVGLYFRERRGPFVSELDVIQRCVDLCGIALRRHERVLERERRAFIDILTGLPNRAAFNAALDHVPLETAGAWALFLIDLDNLKVVNDTFGHSAGDELIRAAGANIARSSAPDRTFRLGGDEFCVLIQSPNSLCDLEATASGILAGLASGVPCDGHLIVPKATIGGAVFGTDLITAADVTEAADQALYHAKETSKGGFARFTPQIGAKITSRRDAKLKLGNAVKSNNIEVYYEPIFSVNTRAVVGLEAVFRTAGRGRLITDDGFREAMKDARIAADVIKRLANIIATDMLFWQERNLSVDFVSLNVSAAEFYASDISRPLTSIFNEAGIATNQVMMEISEEITIGERNRVVRQKIATLRTAGFRVALDQFGMDHGSINNLMGLSVDVLKIKHDFIDRVLPDDPSEMLANSIATISRALKFGIIVTEVGTEAQLSRLSMMGCRLAQGHVLAPAAGRDAIAKLLRESAHQYPEIDRPNSSPYPF
ncbi:EAL domain-containing protein [Brucella tritici]|nr:EAL domain-containing protein [Brucella tritici]